MIQQSIGFHWGAGATGCAVWKGVLLCDLLKYVGAYGPDKGAKHVIFNGSDELPNGTLCLCKCVV
jgi:nitrate reductase (NAD(P)H)